MTDCWLLSLQSSGVGHSLHSITANFTASPKWIRIHKHPNSTNLIQLKTVKTSRRALQSPGVRGKLHLSIRRFMHVYEEVISLWHSLPSSYKTLLLVFNPCLLLQHPWLLSSSERVSRERELPFWVTTPDNESDNCYLCISICINVVEMKSILT